MLLLNIFQGGIAMARKTKDKIAFESTKTTINEHGEVTREERNTVTRVSSEPPFVKVYFNTVLAFRELPKGLQPLISELLCRISYADPNAQYGGQLIYLNPFLKQELADKLGVKINTIEHQLTKLVESNMFRRVGIGTYQANPEYFGRGDWHDIKSIRAMFDFNTGTVTAEIVRGEPLETPMQQLEKHVKKFFTEAADGKTDDFGFLERAAAGKILTEVEAEADD
jgi:hypothetical protein